MFARLGSIVSDNESALSLHNSGLNEFSYKAVSVQVVRSIISFHVSRSHIITIRQIAEVFRLSGNYDEGHCLIAMHFQTALKEQLKKRKHILQFQW